MSIFVVIINMPQIFVILQVIDVSGAEHLKQLLPNCLRKDIITRCGHSIGTDRPGAMTKAIKIFRKDTGADGLTDNLANTVRNNIL